MYLKQIVLDGFKSYAQRTEISGFDPQFNAITGLNGSGKSNILDSICFLLGITNLSCVRAASLQDLVYKSGQAGVTKATVTITFDNRDKKQSPVGYESYDELTVSRQVVIGGRNKYLINGSNATPSRVQDLFRSVQLNVNNPHFLIMQGRITKVLNMKPMEILSMIEEAAGTRMYESKKQSAQKTIEKKDAKLKEIDVILKEEITPTLQKLKEERSSYLEYQKIMREVDHLTRLSVAFQFVRAENMHKEHSTEVESIKSGLEDLNEQILQADSSIEEISATVAKLEETGAKEAQGPIIEMEKKVKELSMSQAVTEATLQSTKDELSAERKNQEGLLKAYEEDKALLESKMKSIEAKQEAYQELQEKSRQAEKAIQKAQQHYQAVTAGLSSNAEGQAETLAAQKIACESAISEAVSEKKQAEMRLKSAQSEYKEKEATCKDSNQSFSKDKSKFDSLKKEIAKIEIAMQKIGYQEGHQEDLLKKRGELESEVSALKDKVQSLESRFPQAQFDYQSPSTGFDRARVKGPVVKLVRVKDPSTATALEITAGGRLFNIVVDTEETGKQLLEQGKLKRRYTIIPLNKIASRSLSNDVIKRAQTLVGKEKARPALSLVGYADELRPAMTYVFGSTLVCDTLDNAKKVTFDKGVMSKSVSLCGDVFDPSGTLRGGSQPKTSSILTKLQELLDCEGELKEKEVELRGVLTELQKIKSLADKYGPLKEQRDAKVHEAELFEMRMGESTHHQQLAQLQELKDNIAKLKDTLKQTAEAERTARAQLEDITSKMADSKSHHERELREAEAAIATAKKESDTVIKEAKVQEQEMAAHRLEAEELERGLESQQQQIDASGATISDKEETLDKQKVANDKAKGILESARKELEEQKAVLRERNKELQRCVQQRKEREKEKVEMALKIKELEHKIAKVTKEGRDAAHRVEVLLDRYDWIAREKQYFGQPNTAYDFGANDHREVERKLSKLQEQKDKLGKSVNMRAMNMLGTAEEKYNDLVKKKEIVQNDKVKIGELISELDQKKNEALQKAYERVNKDFGSIFSTLLPGARARLFPPEGQGVLDGLEVKVGFGEVWKESLQELSGGQRSLVALSLILSLLLFKPAPVYILDEVDAALDLSHTQNIGQMLRSHFKHSQFIVVSLKDGMFNNANVLFKTKFVEGVSTVTRYVNPSIAAHSSSASKENSSRKGKPTAASKPKKQRTDSGVLAPTQ